MAGEKTYYQRLQVLLDIASARSYGSADGLIDSLVHKKTPPNFVYNRWDDKQNRVVGKPSSLAIKRTMVLAANLELLDPATAALTKTGAEAADRASFDRVILRQLRSYFKKSGTSVQAIEQASKDLIRSKRLVLPTADALYERLPTDFQNAVSASRFATLLRLLAASGGITTSRRPIFYAES